jgi:hypothetical protein
MDYPDHPLRKADILNIKNGIKECSKSVSDIKNEIVPMIVQLKAQLKELTSHINIGEPEDYRHIVKYALDYLERLLSQVISIYEEYVRLYHEILTAKEQIAKLSSPDSIIDRTNEEVFLLFNETIIVKKIDAITYLFVQVEQVRNIFVQLVEQVEHKCSGSGSSSGSGSWGGRV